jgi:hypothetical protein
MDRVEILPKTWFRPRKAVIQGGLQLIFVHTRRHPRVHYGSPTFVGSPTDWARNQYSAGPKLVPVLLLAAIGSLWVFSRRCQPQYAARGLHDDAGGHLLHKVTRING